MAIWIAQIASRPSRNGIALELCRVWHGPWSLSVCLSLSLSIRLGLLLLKPQSHKAAARTTVQPRSTLQLSQYCSRPRERVRPRGSLALQANSTWFEPRRSNEPAAAGEKPILRLETFHLPTRDCHLWVDVHPILVVSLELYLKCWTLEKPRRIGTEEGSVAKVGGRGEGTPRCSGETAPPSVDTSRESKRESTASPPPDLQLLATLGSSQWDQWDQCYVHQGRKELMPARPAILLAPNEGLGLP